MGDPTHDQGQILHVDIHERHIVNIQGAHNTADREADLVRILGTYCI